MGDQPFQWVDKEDQIRNTALVRKLRAVCLITVSAFGETPGSYQSIPLALLFYHKLVRALQRALEYSGQDYSAHIAPSIEKKEELQW